MNGHQLAVGRAQDRESLPVDDRRSTTVLRNQPNVQVVNTDVLLNAVQVLNVTAEQISLRDAAYYQEHMIEFMFNKEVRLIINNSFYFYLLCMSRVCRTFILNLFYCS